MECLDQDTLSQVAESPSLASPFTQGTPAYEMKFLLPELQVPEVMAWARQRLTPDPHTDPVTGSYIIHSLYLDTDDLHIYHRRGSYKRCKYRIRRYGGNDLVFLERKLKIGDRVQKRRTAIAQMELTDLESFRTAEAWPGRWFQQRMWTRSLKPVCLISYERAAYTGQSSEGPLRLTLDRQTTCSPQETLKLDESPDALPLLMHQQILELKFRGWMPTLFKRLVAECRLQTTTISKYRLGVQGFGLDAKHALRDLRERH